MGKNVHVTGLLPLVQALKGREFRDVNAALRIHARNIADDLVPVVADAVRQSRAPQAAAMAGTIRTVADRVPVISIGKTNPRFRSGFTRRGHVRRNGEPRTGKYKSPQRRGAIAHGVVFGPKGGRRDHGGANYYRIPRDDSGGPVGASLEENGAAFRAAGKAYLDAYLNVLHAHGFKVTKQGVTR